MKYFAKKREVITAVQWTGEMTAELQALLGDHFLTIDEKQQLIFGNAKGPSRGAVVGDWIGSISGEDFPIGDEQLHKIYEEVTETGRALPPTDAEHDAEYQAFMQKLDDLLVTALRLSPEAHPGIWRDRNKIVSTLRDLLHEHAWVAERNERLRIRKMIDEKLTP